MLQISLGRPLPSRDVKIVGLPDIHALNPKRPKSLNLKPRSMALPELSEWPYVGPRMNLVLLSKQALNLHPRPSSHIPCRNLFAVEVGPTIPALVCRLLWGHGAVFRVSGFALRQWRILQGLESWGVRRVFEFGGTCYIRRWVHIDIWSPLSI